MIGHELTALYGIDHAQTLAIVLPGVMAQQFDRKKAKLAQYSRRVWNLQGSDEVLAREAIVKTEGFFRSLGVNTTLTEYKIPASDIPKIAARVSALYPKLGEHGDINEADIQAILNFRIGAAK
jgi:NADP-dependent alcohol dehydrogenase